MGTPKTRQVMINSILKSIRESMTKGKIVHENKLIAYLGVDEGVSRRTALNYLKDLQLAGKIVRDDGLIWTKEVFDKMEKDRKEREKLAEEAERGNDN